MNIIVKIIYVGSDFLNYKRLSPEEKWILKGIPLLFLIGSFMHFVYELSGNNLIVGLFAPVNESVWEHLKLAVLPIILWYYLYYIIKGRRYNINPDKWFTSGMIALITALITTPLLFYFYTEAFGIESLIIDIFIFFLSILFGQLLALYYYRGYNGINKVIPLAVFVIVIFIFIFFTFNPPRIPMFKDGPTGTYGIRKLT